MAAQATVRFHDSEVYAESGQKKAKIQTTRARLLERDQRILENVHLVKIIAVRVYEGLPMHIELDELVQVGVMGLLEAAEKFDASKNVTFSAYAKHRIRGSILDSLRQMDWASRDQRKRAKQMDAVIQQLSATLCRAPSESEIAKEMGMELERWQKLAGELQSGGTVSASSRPAGQEDGPPPEFPADAKSNPDSICKRHEQNELLNKALHCLPLRYQNVVTMYYAEELTMKEIGQRMGVNESRVSQIHKAALRKMSALLAADGVTAQALL